MVRSCVQRWHTKFSIVSARTYGLEIDKRVHFCESFRRRALGVIIIVYVREVGRRTLAHIHERAAEADELRAGPVVTGTDPHAP